MRFTVAGLMFGMFASVQRVVQQAHFCMNCMLQKGCTIKQKVRSSYAGLMGAVMCGSAHNAIGDESTTAAVEDVVQLTGTDMDICLEGYLGFDLLLLCIH